MNVDESDVEVLNPGQLRNSYFRQQVRLIYDIKDSKKKIPKDWKLFKEFIENTITWNPPDDLVRSVWQKMCYVEEHAYSIQSVPVIELSDDDSDDCTIIEEEVKPTPPKIPLRTTNIHKNKPVVKPMALIEPICHKKPLCSTSQTETNSINFKKSNKVPQKSLYVSKTLQKYDDDVYIVEPDTDIKPFSCSQQAIVENPPKKRAVKRKTEAPKVISEAEAEALRERLLIDKLIELELPKVLKSYYGDNFNFPLELTKKKRSSKKMKLKTGDFADL